MSAKDEADRQLLAMSEVSGAQGLDDWRVLLGALHTRYLTRRFATGLELVDRIGAAAEEADHHPDIDLRYFHVNLKLVSHDVGGLTRRDVAMARRISEVAAELGVSAAPDRVQAVEIALNTTDTGVLLPFWEAVLGGDASGDEIVDRGGDSPGMWFQGTEDVSPGAMRFHVDVTVPHDVARDRIRAALDAGGTLVDESHAPAFWVLHDPQGNAACICTSQGRD